MDMPDLCIDRVNKKDEIHLTDQRANVCTLSLKHTPGHVNCPVCERLNTGALHVITAEVRFTEAARIWLEFCSLPAPTGDMSARYIKENTEVSYKQYCESLALFFSDMPLNTIRIEHLRGYQQCRISGTDPFVRYRRPQDKKERKVGSITFPPLGKTPCPVAPKKVNQELSILRRIMLQGDAWTPELGKLYRPLMEEESEAQRALEPEEQALWMATSQSKEDWLTVHWYSQLGIGATLSTNELQHLRVGDINLNIRTLAVAGKGVKCKGRKRTIALVTAEDVWAAEQLLERGKKLGSTQPQHYVFPFRERPNTFNPTMPMSSSGMKRDWQEVREATGLLWFRPYDLRHTGGTRLAEEGWRPAQIKSRMGHITDAMNDHYTHITEAAQRREYERVQPLKFAPRSERYVDYRHAEYRRRVV